MTLNELKERLIQELMVQVESITGENLMEAEGTGIDFDFTIGNNVYNISMATEYDEEKNEYIKEEYQIN